MSNKYLPEFPNAEDTLRRNAVDGLAKRYPKEKESGGGQWDTIQKRLDYELDVITKMDFSNYFLIVADYVNWSKEHDIPVGPGRGSAAGSIVAYTLGITAIDPIKYDLLFERFLNPERISMPDFDIDFANEGRDEVIKYVTEKYGKDSVGQISTSDHLSVHAAGIVISKSPLADLVPVYTDKDGNIVTQYDYLQLEKCGLVKFDFLGLKTLDVIKHTVELIRSRGSEYANFNIENIPENDPATFTLFQEGNTYEVFQFESDGMKEILKQAKPDKITDLIALNALYRPGPMEHIPQFIDCKNGEQEITYPDPCLEDILKETYGVIVYQEQVMQIAQRIVGYSLAEADCLRRAMGSKKSVNIAKEKLNFLAGATKQGFSEAEAVEIYDMLIPFAGYSFNKSHAAAYTVLAYQTAYLKANFHKEYETACEKFYDEADTDY